MIGRNHLRVVSDRYNDLIVDGKAAISSVDAKIIDIFIDYFVFKEDFEVAALLANWKDIPDKQFLNSVFKFTNYDEIEHQSDDKLPEMETDLGPTFLEFAGLLFNVYEISLIDRGVGWSEERLCNMFYIEINSKSKIKSRLGGLKVEFKLESTRDKKLEELKIKLTEWGVKFI